MQTWEVIGYVKPQMSDHGNVESVHRVLSFLNEENNKEMVCIACSGGSDSVFLVEYILENFHCLKRRLAIRHFNHPW
jgi:tRNA(Ile)-lysidine synthase TilS/MesJ